MAANNSGAKTVASAASWNRNTVIVPNKKIKSYLPIPTNVPACVVSSVLLASVAIRWQVGSKKDQHNPKLEETLLPAQPEDILEVDEMWSFVQQHWQKRWIWTAMCRRTRQIIAYAIGDRSHQTCQLLWERIPVSYKGCHSFSDLWDAYQLVFPPDTHQCIGKGERQTNHMERWYNRLRQSNARFVRKTLSFSKSDTMHEIMTRSFIIKHNLSLTGWPSPKNLSRRGGVSPP